MLEEIEKVSSLVLHTHTRTHTFYLKQQYVHLEIIDDNLTKRKNALETVNPEKGTLILL